MPQPSLQPAPSACAEKLLHRPSGAIPRSRLNSTNVARRAHHLHAAGKRQVAFAQPQPRQARCSATSDEEHAVSTVSAGPCRPNTYDTRPDSTLLARPVTSVAIKRHPAPPLAGP